ncbi:sodium:calcium antiporter [Thermoleophilia bacterium SCSIO 60948]|nr:sodium:calcium antiporter [Thermoleophilia bacterium SCSIO 60948]
MIGDYVLLLVAFVLILAGALVFTNAVEWAGHKLNLGEGAVGSLLAAVGTAMPETLIPVIAIIGGKEGSDDVAIGAIIGAPFLLATIAMAIVGLAAVAYRNRRKQGSDLRVDRSTLERDLRFFLIFFTFAVLIGIGAPDAVRYPAAAVLILAYVYYVYRTIRDSSDVAEAEELDKLHLGRPFGRADDPPVLLIVLQFILGLGIIVGAAELFVEELIKTAESLGTEPIVLSLILAPLATELPEKANSFFWVRDGKDSLALGNITGAMVFQSTIPVALGIALTEWDLDTFSFISAGLGIIGGFVAYETLHRRAKFIWPAIVAWGVLYAIFPLYVAFIA